MSFKKYLDQLNKTQREAADNIEGASLVIAPAGSGKTALLSARIGNMLLSDAQINPNVILCMTFTDAGAVAMRKRLIEYIGVEAFKIYISTFHSFCNDVVMSNLDYFGARQLEVVSSLEVLEILYEIIDDLPMNHPLSRVKGDSYFEVGRLTDLFQTMKNENWNERILAKAVDSYLNDLPLREEYIYKRKNDPKGIKVGDVKTHLIEVEKERMIKVIAASKLLVPEYNKKLRERNRYDFADMIQWVIKAFKDSENFLLMHQERFQYILLDEFQDTNGSQMELLHLLLSFWPDPNIFCVADLSQTIYGFQGARAKNVVDFKNYYKPDLYILKNNYRSTQNILNHATNLINYNLTGNKEISSTYDNTIIASNDSLDDSLVPTVNECDNYFEEERMIVAEILKLKEKGVSPSEIAVIYRKHRQAENIIKEFSLRGIAVNVKKRVNVIFEPIIIQILNILQYITKESTTPGGNDQLLFKILHYPYWEIPRKDIEGFVLRKPTEESDALEPKIERVIDVLGNLIAEYYNKPLIHLVESIINDSGLLNYIISHNDKLRLMVILNSFFTFVKGEAFKNPAMDGNLLLQKIAKMIKNDLDLTIMDIASDEEGVVFTTAHGSKGLEFEYVFLMGCQRDQWENTRAGMGKYKFPDTLTFSNNDDQLESSRRLFYVAMTRAKQGLTISYAVKDNNGKDLERSQFIDESVLPIHRYQYTEGRIETLKYTLSKTEFNPALESQFIDKILENYRLSTSHLSKYLNCQVDYYYENVLRVPFVANENLIFGNAVHIALKIFYDSYKKDRLMNSEQLYNEFYKEMLRNKVQLTEEVFNRRLEFGKICLDKYLEVLFPLSTKITVNEKNVKNVVIDDIPVKYIFDKIEFRGNNVTIKDYKTGKVNSIIAHLKGPTEKHEQGGDYWRQLIFGKLVVDNMYYNAWKVEGAGIEVIDDKEMQYIPLEINSEMEYIVKEQIKQTYQGITNKEFSKGCGECKWCKFQEEIKLNQ